MSLKEIRMPEGVKDIDELVRSGAEVPAPIPIGISPEVAFKQEPTLTMEETLPERIAAPDFEDFLLSESADAMEKQMLEDKFVLGRMAIMGQFTVFYGGPNAGKTLIGLKLLVEAIQSGEIDGSNVYYINADDTYKGIVTKKRLSEEHSFKMLVPGRDGFQADMLVEILRARSASGQASGTIVILDTLKKFTDLMSKSASSAFGDVQRCFTSNGGTVIGYAHVNKHKNDDGESVYSGTTDIVDDGDCAYILDVVEDDGDIRTVRFRNIKDRGDVAQVVNYQYKSKGNNRSVPYLELFYSLAEIDPIAAKNAQLRAEVADRLALNNDAITAILDCIKEGTTNKTELTAAAASASGLSKPKIIKVLNAHIGTDRVMGHRWTCGIQGKNSHVYSAL